MSVCPHCGAAVQAGWKFCPSCTGSLADAVAALPPPARSPVPVGASPAPPAVTAQMVQGAVQLALQMTGLKAGHACVLDFVLGSGLPHPVAAVVTLLCDSVESGQVRSARVLLAPGLRAQVPISAETSRPGETLFTALIELSEPESGGVFCMLRGNGRLWVQSDSGVQIGTTINVAEGARALGVDASIELRGNLTEQLDEVRGAPAWFERGQWMDIPLLMASPDFVIPPPRMREPPQLVEELPVDLTEANDAAYREFVDSWGDDAQRLDDHCWELADPARGLAAWAQEKWERLAPHSPIDFHVEAMDCAEGAAALGEVWGWEMTATVVRLELLAQLSGDPGFVALEDGEVDDGITALERAERTRWTALALAFARFYYKGDSRTAVAVLSTVDQPPDIMLLFSAFLHEMRAEPEAARDALQAIGDDALKPLVAYQSARQLALMGRKTEAVKQWAALASGSPVFSARLLSEPGMERAVLQAAMKEAAAPTRQRYKVALRELEAGLAQRREEWAGRWSGDICGGWVRLLNLQIEECQRAAHAADRAALPELNASIEDFSSFHRQMNDAQEAFVDKTERDLSAALDSLPAVEASTESTGGLRSLFGRRERAAREAQTAEDSSKRAAAEAALREFLANRPSF